MSDVRGQLHAALQALFHVTDTSTKEQASRWLEEWQQSVDAWTMAHEILQDPSAGLEAQYLCAQTLRTKISRDFEELPPDATLSLRDSLVSLLLRYARAQPAVRTQLCLAVAALVSHLPSAQWGNGGVLGWLSRRLGGEPSEISLPCMLELLTVLPQEAAGYQPTLRPERRRQLHQEMEAALPQALALLAECLARVQGRGKEQALEAFAAWLTFSGASGLAGSVLAASPLTAAALDGLLSQEVFYAATDAVIELIYCTSHAGRPRDDMASLVQGMVPRIMTLRPRFHVCAAAAAAERDGRAPPHANVEDHEEDAKAIARLFAEVGEAYTNLIAGGGPEVMPPVEALLDVAAHPDDSVCAISYNFWHRLSRALTEGHRPQPLFGGDTEALPPEEVERRLNTFAPAFRRLVELVQGRVRFPDDFDSWHRDERDEFRRARVAVGDTLIDAASVLGGAETLRLLAEPLIELSGRVSSGGDFDWRAAEAALYCIRAVHRFAPAPRDSQLLASLFAALPTLPPSPQLQYTAALAIGAYADWLAEMARSSSAGAELLNVLLASLMKSLGSEEAAGAAALSLRRICDGCAPLLGPSFPALLDLYRRMQPSGDVANGGSDDLDLDEEDVGHIVEAVTLVASTLPDGERQACVQRLMDVVVQPMQTILGPWMAVAVGQGRSGQSAPAPGSPEAARLPLVLPLAERVTTIFRAVRDPVDVGEALVRLWPWLEVALDAFGPNDGEAAEKLCRVPRNAIRNAGKASAPAVPALAASLPRRFETTLHSCYLYVASELIKAFGDDPSSDSSLGPALERLLVAATGVLGSLRDVSARPDVADDAFLLAGRALSYAPRLIVTSRLLPVLLATVHAGLLVQHREACCSITAFMVRLLDPATLRKCPSSGTSTLQTALAPLAPGIVRLALAGALGALPGSRLKDLTDVLYAVLKVTGSLGFEWTAAAVGVLPEEGATLADKQRFLNVCQTIVADGIAVDDERELVGALEELSQCCRRNRKAQTATLRVLLPPELQYLV